MYEINWNKTGLLDKCFSFWNGATHHSDALQSVVFVWDLNCVLHIHEYDDTGFKIVVVEKLQTVNVSNC
jgi:hypothetical protein